MSSKNQKWDWSLLGKAHSLSQTILGRFRRFHGENGVDWSLIEWLATDAPDSLFGEIWGFINTSRGAWVLRKMEHERMEKLVWKFSPKPGNWQHASTVVPSIHGGWRLPTRVELGFAIEKQIPGFVRGQWYWTSEISSDKTYATIVCYPDGDFFPKFVVEEHGVCHVRDRQ